MTTTKLPAFESFLARVPNADGPCGRAWAMVLGAGMPPEAALDWVRQHTDSDDVKSVKSAMFLWVGMALGLYGAELAVHQWRPSDQKQYTAEGCEALIAGELDQAEDGVSWITNADWEKSSEYTEFAKEMMKVLGLCRTIAAQPE